MSAASGRRVERFIASFMAHPSVHLELKCEAQHPFCSISANLENLWSLNMLDHSQLAALCAVPKVMLIMAWVTVTVRCWAKKGILKTFTLDNWFSALIGGCSHWWVPHGDVN
jgi:hypothetical protein